VNLLNILLVFLIATSCIKVGKNEEYGHQRSSLRRKIYQKECKTALLIEKVFGTMKQEDADLEDKIQANPRMQDYTVEKK
jgi:hypothetical protein